MNMAAFTDAAPAWAAAGIVPLPVAPDGKKTMVKQPEAFGRPAAMELVTKPRYAAANLGFMCGSHNRLTVVDIDSPADAELQYALATYGDSPIIVQTPSGGRHIYYRHAGEQRSVRPDKSRPVDILGGGLAVAPPSVRRSGGGYGWLRGGLSNVANVPKIRAGSLPEILRATPLANPQAPIAATIEQGTRNVGFLRIVVALAHDATSQSDLLAQSREANAALCKPPLSDVEVHGAVGSAWRYKEQGTLMGRGMESAIILPRAALSNFLAAGEIDPWALLGLLQKEHAGIRETFAASPEAMAQAQLIRGWGKNRYRSTIRKLCDAGELEQLYGGGKGPHDAALYRLRPLAKGSNPDPNTNQILPPLSPSLRGTNHKRRFREWPTKNGRSFRGLT